MTNNPLTQPSRLDDRADFLLSSEEKRICNTLKRATQAKIGYGAKNNSSAICFANWQAIVARRLG